ncbi:hypothetical protein DdX_05923 [Ditylenchus destructor]|uniref:Uncharacterized protein n=1 Tax=Ditylenchus destructor TaxID=166010 RepID=A0AAD4N6M8_9BILA|nr:hypothetical protein DdX_05923 [Ditylenchus destructor]
MLIGVIYFISVGHFVVLCISCCKKKKSDAPFVVKPIDKVAADKGSKETTSDLKSVKRNYAKADQAPPTMEKPKISTEKLKNNSSVEQTILKSTFLMPGESAIGSKDVKVTLTPTTPVERNDKSKPSVLSTNVTLNTKKGDCTGTKTTQQSHMNKMSTLDGKNVTLLDHTQVSLPQAAPANSQIPKDKAPSIVMSVMAVDAIEKKKADANLKEINKRVLSDMPKEDSGKHVKSQSLF